MKVGIFGGTFDPPHIGHLILADEARFQLKLDHVLWVLTPFPPHKKNQKISPLEDRLEMVLMAISENSKFSLSRVDIDRLPPHYARDTVRLLREKSPNDEFYYLMGADSLNDLPRWHDPVHLVADCGGLGIMKRQNEIIDTDKLEEEIPGIKEKIRIFDIPIIDISASDIRHRIELHLPIRYFVPEKIYDYILNNKLYQN